MILDQLSVFPHTERLVPDSGASETSPCTFFDFVKIFSPNVRRVGILFVFHHRLKFIKDNQSCLLLLTRDGRAQWAATKSPPDL